MTWQGYWVPLLVQVAVNIGAGALFGVPAAWLVRRALRPVALQLGLTSEHAAQAAVSASQGHDATNGVAQRLKRVEEGVAGLYGRAGDDTSAALSHRLRDDVRLRRLEQLRQAGGEDAAVDQGAP